MKKQAYNAPRCEVVIIKGEALMNFGTNGKGGVYSDPAKGISDPDLVLGRGGGWDDDD